MNHFRSTQVFIHSQVLGMLLLGCGITESKKTQAVRGAPSVPSSIEPSPNNGSVSASVLPFLTAKDLEKPKNVSALMQLEAEQRVKELASTFQAGLLAPNESESGSEPDCMSRIHGTLKGQLVGQMLVFSGSLDFRECLAELSTDEVKYELFKSTFYTSLSCEGVDLKPYVGKSMQELSELEKACQGKSHSSQIQNKIQSAFSFLNSASPLKLETIIIHAFGTSDLGPCTTFVKGASESYGPKCQSIDSEVRTENGKLAESRYQVLSYNNVKWTRQNQESWYESGTVNIGLNDWEGQVSFRGAQVAPTYSMKSGSMSAAGEFPAIGAEAFDSM